MHWFGTILCIYFFFFYGLPTLQVAPLVQVPDEPAPHLLVSGQGEGVGQQGCGVQVVHLANGRFSEAAQAPAHHRPLSRREEREREERTKEDEGPCQ